MIKKKYKEVHTFSHFFTVLSVASSKDNSIKSLNLSISKFNTFFINLSFRWQNLINICISSISREKLYMSRIIQLLFRINKSFEIRYYYIYLNTFILDFIDGAHINDQRSWRYLFEIKLALRRPFKSMEDTLINTSQIPPFL